MELRHEQLLERLFYLDRSLLGKNNDMALKLISESIPLEIHQFKSGVKCCDWKIPKEWVLHHAKLMDSKGNLIACADTNILRVVNYSNSFVGEVTRKELEDHVYFSESAPESIPYRTAYYGDAWGFCLTKAEYDSLTDQKYFVDIKTEFVDSCLSVGEAVLRGDTTEEIVFSSYLCHPRQAHDGLSGVILLMKLYEALRQKKNKYTYRFLFGPETIGPIAMISSGALSAEKINFGFVSTCVGRKGVLNYKRTFLGDHPMDNIMESLGMVTTEFCPTGSDERQFSSPNVRIPSGHITSQTYEAFSEYHTSFDDLESISMDTIDAVAQKYLKALERYEARKTFLVSHRSGGEPFLSKYGLYRTVGIPGHSDWSRLRNWVIFYSDGNHGALDISKKISQPLESVQHTIDVLLENGVIEESS